MSETEKRSWGLPPIVAALLASMLGMFSCYKTLRWELVKLDSANTGESSGSSVLSQVIFAAVPLLAGAIVIAVTYYVTVQDHPRTEPVQPAESAPAGEASTGAGTPDSPPANGNRGPAHVLAIIVGSSAAIAGVIGGLLTFSGGSAVGTSDVLTGVFVGVMFGGALGLLLAVPAALAIAYTNRKRPR